MAAGGVEREGLHVEGAILQGQADSEVLRLQLGRLEIGSLVGEHPIHGIQAVDRQRIVIEQAAALAAASAIAPPPTPPHVGLADTGGNHARTPPPTAHPVARSIFIKKNTTTTTY